VLDWGCGCGRLSAQFLATDAPITLIGADLDQVSINWCQRNLPDSHYHVVSPEPPSPYYANEFDLIFSYSVLTHLGRDSQEAWLKEMHRILAPGGYFLATVKSEIALKFDTKSARPCWTSDEFFDVEDPTLNGIAPPGYYRAAFQSENYTRRQFGKYFEIVEYVLSGEASGEDLILMRKA